MRALYSMQNLDTANAATATNVNANDLGPLAWVLDELRKSLDSATKALRRYVRDAELARGSDLAAVDSGQLRISRQQLHQAVGALDMVGFAGPAALLRGMENAVQRFVARPELCTEAAALKIERASFALTGYLETVLAGKGQTPVALFFQYAEVQEVAAATRVHPADLWPYLWRWIDVASTDAHPAPLNSDTRGLFDKSALMVIKSFDASAAAELAQLSAAIAVPQGAAADRQFTIFWRIAAGFFNAIGTSSLVGDVYVKRTVSRILMQLAGHVKGDMGVSDRLAQDLLFFCAQAQPQGLAALLGEVRMAYALGAYPPVDYTKSMFGQFDPVLLVQARKRISSAKESWSGLAAGDMGKLKTVQDHFSLIVDSITKLLPTGQALSQALMGVAEASAHSGQAPAPALGMEVATSILYLEAGFEDFDPSDAALTDRINHLAQRVENARQGATNQALEPWMEELYRRVSDRQTMGSVVGELKNSLAELEKSMDQFFRDPQDKTVIANVPSRLAQMRGVLSVLGLDHASQAVLRMRDSVEQIMVTEVDDVRARAAGTFDKLGNNLGALGFLIDMLSYQPVLAKKLFVFDDATGELKPLMGRVNAPIPMSDQATAEAANAARATAITTAAVAISSAGVGAAAALASVVPAPSTAPLPAPVVVAEDTFGDDAELRDIFLEEAREVIENGQAALAVLAVEPGNLEEMTTLRRAFHTLKGSSRMVGLNTFGDAGWSLEQMLNSWLADQKPAEESLRTTASQALAGMGQWVEAIALNQAQSWSAVPFRASADALRVEGKFLALQLGEPVAPHQVAPVAVPEAAIDATPATVAVAAMAAAVLPAIAAAPAPVPAAEAAVPDFDFDMSEFFASGDAPVTAEPLLAAAATVAEPEQPAAQAADPDAVDDLDFAFDLAVAELDASSPMPQPAAQALEPAQAKAVEFASLPTEALPSEPELVAVPALQQAAEGSTLTVGDGLSSLDVPSATVDDDLMFDFDLGTAQEDTPALATLAVADAPLDNATYSAIEIEDGRVDFSAQAFAGSAAEPAAEPTEDLVSVDEFAAFERAMLAQDALMAADTPAAPGFGATTLATPANTATEVVDFTPQATRPMQLMRELSVPEPVSDLGFDLGDFGGLADTGVITKVGLAGAVAYTAVTAAPAAPKSTVAVEALPVASSASDYAPLSTEDQYKAIGPLRISLPLYNVYLNEADEWSRRLVTSLSEWALEPGLAIPNDAVVFAHSLAGSSGTVGFSALSGLARSMENALQHIQTISDDASYSAHIHAGDFVAAAEEIRRLLHQFAAGLLRDPLASVQESLGKALRAPELATEYHPLGAASATSGFGGLDSFKPFEPLAQGNAAQTAIDNVADIGFDLDLPSAPAALEPLTVTIAAPTASAFAALDAISSVTVITAAVGITAATAVGSGAFNAADAELEAMLAAAVPYDDSAVLIDMPSEPAAAPAPAPAFAPAPTPTPTPTPATTPIFAAVGLKPVGMAAGLNTASVLSVVPRSLTEQEAEDEIDVADAIDPDLFPIFEEEALELFPQMSGALRQWTARPSNTGARSEVLRGLHTLKGSARLAGAMRLGELAHRMESSVENVPQEDAQTAQIEPLAGLLDAMQANLDRLRYPQESVVQIPAATAAAVASAPAESVVLANLTLPLAAASSMPPALSTMAPLRASSNLAAPVLRASSNQTVRVRSQLLDRLVNQAGEVMITRSRLEAELGQLRGSLGELTGNLDKLRMQLRDIEVQSESQMQSRMALAKETSAEFDPLEFDRFTRVQELTRMMAESVNDVATVQRSIQRTVEATEDDLVAQARQTRELQRDLLRTRMVEFEGISERLYRVVRQAGKDAGKQVKLDIIGGSIEMDRGVLDRMTPAFEHLLRNCVAHGIETAETRTAAGKDGSGQITISLHQEGNDISVEFRDDGAGLNLARIRERATAQGLLGNAQQMDDNEAANLIFTAGFTTATQITELSGRGVGMDVVRSEVVSLGGRIETSTAAGQGTSFKLVLPLTTAVTQVVMLRIGNLSIGVPANLVEAVRRATPKELQAAYNTGTFDVAGEALPFFWSGALLQHTRSSDALQGKTIPVLVFRSAAQRIVAHVDEVLGNQEVVVKNLGPQLSRLPGLAGMSVLASGAVALIYNPVALATVYGLQARNMSADSAEPHVLAGLVTDVEARDLSGDAAPVVPLVPAVPKAVSAAQIPLILVVDDSITVRRVTQRLLQREGYRVALAADGLLALERLAEELPNVVLSDIEMPRMDGFDLVRNMKADPRLAKLPVITITSRIAEKHREHAMALGVDHYLGKPYSEEELLSLIRRYTSADMPA
jgi:chemosensory pili system protein ChpA (sensor histidine kinase/response regulator)